MAKKAAKAKKVSKNVQKVKVVGEDSAWKPTREVNVEKIKNGYVVSKYTGEGHQKEFVKQKAAVGRVVNKMIGG